MAGNRKLPIYRGLTIESCLCLLKHSMVSSFVAYAMQHVPHPYGLFCTIRSTLGSRVFARLFNVAFSVDGSSHWLPLNDFSPSRNFEWIFVCFLREPLCPNCFAQTRHVKRLNAECTLEICTVNEAISLKYLLHFLQANGFSPVCMYKWNNRLVFHHRGLPGAVSIGH